MTAIRRRPIVAGLIGAASASLGGCIDAFESSDSGGAVPDLEAFYVVTEGESDGGNLYAGRRIGRVTVDSAASSLRTEAWYEPADDRRVVDVEPLGDGAIVADAAADDAVDLATTGSASEPTNTSVQLRRLGADGSVEATRRVDGLASIAIVDDAVIAVSSHGAFTFDRSLDPLGAAELSGGLEDKHMEDVLVHDGVAYVVDDVVSPRYLFRVDVSDPTDPSFLEAVQTMGVGQSLGQQWLAPEDDRWYVLQSTYSRLQHSQRVLATAMDRPESAGSDPPVDAAADLPVRPRGALEGQRVHEATLAEGQTVSTSGTLIHDVTSRAPAWAAVERDEAVHLALLQESDDPSSLISFDRRHSLPAPARVTRVGEHVVAVGSESDAPTVSILDTAAGDGFQAPIDTAPVVHVESGRQR